MGEPLEWWVPIVLGAAVGIGVNVASARRGWGGRRTLLVSVAVSIPLIVAASLVARYLL